MSNIYEKNLAALKNTNPELVKDIEKIKSNERFELFQGDTENAINILEKKSNQVLYNNPIEEYNDKKEEYVQLREFPYLYFFGIGNGNEIIFLLQSQELERLLIVEPEVEILYMQFHLIDYSNYIKSSKIIFLLLSQLTFKLAIELFGKHKSRFYAKVYTLHILLPFYENYKDEIISTNETLIKAIHYVISFSGNDVNDNLIGVKHHIQNIPTMLQGGKFTELITKKSSNVAIVVSTGPSLHKQLSLLREIQDSVTIISVDASLPILEKNGIKPDIVTSIERVSLTSSFFKNSSEKFQKDIIFLSVSLQHKETLESIKGKKVLVMRPFDYNRFFKLDDYGYLGNGMSSANLAHELAIAMKYTNIILIGQDLAFAKDGRSHSKDHVLGEDDVKKEKIETSLVEAYGGKGEVATSGVWVLFRNSFEQTIESVKDTVETINATQGGARIKGSIELSFKEAIDKHVNKKFVKNKIEITLKNSRYKSQLKSVRYQINSLIKDGIVISKKLEQTFLTIHEAVKRLENITKKEALEKFSVSETAYLLHEIETIRALISKDSAFNEFYYDFMQSDLLHIELDLAIVKVRYIDNAEDNQEKAIQWILLHRELLFTLSGIMKNAIGIIKEAKKQWAT